MCLRLPLACLAVLWLAGCELIPESPLGDSRPPSTNGPAPGTADCQAEIPDFADEACLLHDWMAFGLASQRGDRDWRDGMLTRLAGSAAEQRLARAVALAWGNENEWHRASELYKADLHAAPGELQPLLRYWLNELEGRRAAAGRLATARRELAELQAQHAGLEEENAALAEKLEALTAIEQSINLRQQTE